MSAIYDLLFRWLPFSRARQCGALPYRVEDNELTVLLVTTRGGKRWMLPKGRPELFRSLAASAAEEAFEEAGVRGTIAQRPVGAFYHAKVLRGGKVIICDITVYPLLVETVLENWPEAGSRERRWLRVADAVTLIANPSLADLLTRFAAARHLWSSLDYDPAEASATSPTTI